MNRKDLTAFVTRRYPLLSGCSALANSRFMKRIGGNVEGQAWVRLDCGKEILVSLDDYVGKSAFFFGDIDRKVTETARRIARPGDTVFDIGANIGLVTLNLSAIVGDNGLVHCFEPNPHVNNLLGQSLERNRITNVRLHKFALGSQPGELTLSFPQVNAGMATLLNELTSDDWEKVSVPVKTLSSVVEELGIGPVRLVKMDVEGFEENVLEGADDWLSSSPPDAIIFECNPLETRRASQPVITKLDSKGYKIFAIPRSYFSLGLVPVNLAGGEIPASNDFLAVRENRCEEILRKFRVLS